MKLDATKMKDWQIAEAAEATMKPVRQLAEELGLEGDELLPMGRLLGKVDFKKTGIICNIYTIAVFSYNHICRIAEYINSICYISISLRYYCFIIVI